MPKSVLLVQRFGFVYFFVYIVQLYVIVVVALSLLIVGLTIQNNSLYAVILTEKSMYTRTCKEAHIYVLSCGRCYWFGVVRVW